ncbi:MAG TPA: HEAT repeat domain-containing protein [Nitrospiria bacterium]
MPLHVLVPMMLLSLFLLPHPVHAVHQPPDIPGVKPVCATTEECLDKIRSDDPAVKDEAVSTLGQLKDPRSVPPLIEIVRNHVPNKDEYFADIRRDNYTVVTALRALGMIGDRRAIPVLVEFIKREPFIQLRVLAAEMIRLIGMSSRDVPMLLDLLNDPHTSLRFVIFEAIRRSDDPVNKRYTQRFENYVPRADVIEDSVTPPPAPESIGVPIYPKALYLLYASASDQWIMREKPQRLSKARWLHTFFTKDPLKKVAAYYEDVLGEKSLGREEIEKTYRYGGEDDAEPAYIGQGVGFILKKADRPELKAPVVLVSVYEDKVLEGTAITISAPK